MMNFSRSQGFTLIEVLIALTLFAILAAMTSSSLYYAFNAKERVSVQAEQLNALQLTVALIKQDIEQIVMRPIRDDDLHLMPELIGKSHSIELTRGGISNPNSLEKRSTLKRIALLCQNHQLIRRTWSTLDPLNPSEFKDRVLLDKLEKCDFAYLDANLSRLTLWRKNSMPGVEKKEALPKAVQLNLVLPNWGKASFWLLIPSAIYDHV